MTKVKIFKGNDSLYSLINDPEGNIRCRFCDHYCSTTRLNHDLWTHLSSDSHFNQVQQYHEEGPTCEAVRNDFLSCILTDFLPFTVIENKFMRKYIHHFTRHDMPDLAKAVSAEISKHETQDFSNFVAVFLSFDGWFCTSEKVHYMGFTLIGLCKSGQIQFVPFSVPNNPNQDPLQRYKEYFLALVPVSTESSFEIKEAISQVVNGKFHLMDKLISCTTDNAKNVTLACRLVGLLDIPCIIHSSELIIGAFLKLLQLLFKPLWDIQKFTGSSEFLNWLKSYSSSFETFLLIPGESDTRWWALQRTLKTFLKDENIIELFVNLMKISMKEKFLAAKKLVHQFIIPFSLFYSFVKFFQRRQFGLICRVRPALKLIYKIFAKPNEGLFKYYLQEDYEKAVDDAKHLLSKIQKYNHLVIENNAKKLKKQKKLKQYNIDPNLTIESPGPVLLAKLKEPKKKLPSTGPTPVSNTNANPSSNSGIPPNSDIPPNTNLDSPNEVLSNPICSTTKGKRSLFGKFFRSYFARKAEYSDLKSLFCLAQLLDPVYCVFLHVNQIVLALLFLKHLLETPNPILKEAVKPFPQINQDMDKLETPNITQLPDSEKKKALKDKLAEIQQARKVSRKQLVKEVVEKMQSQGIKLEEFKQLNSPNLPDMTKDISVNIEEINQKKWKEPIIPPIENVMIYSQIIHFILNGVTVTPSLLEEGEIVSVQRIHDSLTEHYSNSNEKSHSPAEYWQSKVGIYPSCFMKIVEQVCAIAVTSVSTERLFSAAKKVTEERPDLGPADTADLLACVVHPEEVGDLVNLYFTQKNLKTLIETQK